MVEKPNASLRILDVAEAMRPYESKLRVWGHFKRETYFRLLLPQLLPDHHKVLYLDADMICLSDLAPLFDQEGNLNVEDLEALLMPEVKKLGLIEISGINKRYSFKEDDFLRLFAQIKSRSTND